MKKHSTDTDEQPARGDERQVIIASLILFIISSMLRYLGPDGASCF